MKFDSKTGKKLFGYLVSPFTLGLVVTSGVVSLANHYYESRHSVHRLDRGISKYIQQIHEKTIDWRMNDRGQIPGSDRVAILAVDEKSIELEGHWPWSREKMARLVDRTLEAGAKIVAFDMIFSEADQKATLPTLMKMRKQLSVQQQLSNELAQLFDTEIDRSDSDRVFSSTIKSHADRLILGSFYDGLDPRTPYKDFCVDALFARTPESRYWSKEALPLEVTDVPLKEAGFPKEFKDHLEEYFTALEVSKSADWFSKQKDLAPRISEKLDNLSEVFTPETYPGLATLWLNNDVESTRAMLEEIDPKLADEAGVATLFGRFGSAFTSKEAASLQLTIRNAGKNYCDRLFTEGDELLHQKAYKDTWGDSPEALEQFEQMSWTKYWPKISGTLDRKEDLASVIARIKSKSLANGIPQVNRWVTNIPVLAEGTKHSGYFNAIQDTDGSIRRSILAVRRGNSYMPSLALKAFMVDQGLRAKILIDTEAVGTETYDGKVIRKLDLIDQTGKTSFEIPVDKSGHLMINYSGGSYMFPHISATDLLSDEAEMTVVIQKKNSDGRWFPAEVKVKKAEFLKDKILIAGATAVGIYDLRVTPFEENYPGVETHANVLSNLLAEKARRTSGAQLASLTAPGFLKVHPDEENLMWMVLAGLGIVLSGLLSYVGSITGLILTVAGVGGIYAIDRFVLFKSGIVATTLFPTFLVIANFVTLTFYKYFTEERKKRELKGTFEKYVSPAIVAEVLSDPENIELGGKKMELTVMFSDVRGFTTISEKLDPRELSNLLNSYLTPMTNLVFQNKGTLDKYMGDAVMAFWGAPIHFPDHAEHACRCALQMLVKLKELQKEYRDKGLPEIDVGIGLNTGEMSVGNMGSDTVRSYTVMGDAVNLGSRLEGINKQYGTRIIISEFTQAAIKDHFITREVDWVRVKGKAQPVRIYELIAEGSVSDETTKLLEYFDQGLIFYHQRKFTEGLAAFEAALAIRADDAVSQLYVERCRDYLEEPPPPDWDGVFNMKSK